MKGSFIIVSACFLLYLPLATAAPLEEVVINESEPGITIPPEQAAPEPKPKTTVDPETLPISVRSGSAQLDWLAESDRRIIDLNWYVDHLFKKNQVLKRQFEQFEDILKKLHEEEEKLASEMKRWNMGLFFPGMAHVHETIGIKGDFINKVGAKVAAFLVLTLTSRAYGQVEDEGEIIAEEEEKEKSKDVSTGVKSGLQPCQLDYLLRKLGEECPKIRDDQIMSLEHTIGEIANNMQAIGAIINQDKDMENIQDDSSQIWQDFGGPAISILPDADYLNVVNITVPGEISGG
ncbi:uncharacterized protein LOC115224852 [Argonauta hians]